MAFEREGHYHAIDVAVLKSLIAELRDDDILVPNAVSNLKIIRDGEYAGYVDFGEEIVELFESRGVE